jgi:hypothetical protein
MSVSSLPQKSRAPWSEVFWTVGCVGIIASIFAILVASIVQSPARDSLATQSTSAKKATKPTAKFPTIDQRVITEVKNARKLREEAIVSSVEQTITDLKQLRSRVKTDYFIENVTGYYSKYRYLTSSQFEKEVLTQFGGNVLSASAITDTIEINARALKSKLNLIDNQLLVSLKIDSSFDGQQIALTPISSTECEQETNAIIKRLSNDLANLIVQDVAATTSGVVVGAVTTHALHDSLAYDKNGKYQPVGDLTAEVLGFFAGALTEQVVEKAIDGKGTLKKRLTQGIDSLFFDISYGASSSSTWQRAFRTTADQHRKAIDETIASHFGMNAAKFENHTR